MWHLLFGIICFFQFVAFGYNSPGFPHATLTPRHEMLIVSDTKSILYDGRQYVRLPFSKKPSSFKATGGIVQINEDKTRFLACLGSQVFTYDSDVAKIKPVTLNSLHVSCVLNETGVQLFYLEDKDQLIVDNKIFSLSQRFHSWHSAGENFFGVTMRGEIFRLAEDKLEKIDSLKLQNIDKYSSISSRSDTIIHASSYGVHLYRFNQSYSEITKTRLPISPCSEKQVCGTSLGVDGSWLVSGFWGTYAGIGDKVTRIKTPTLSRESGGTAISHYRMAGRFLLISFDDAEIGSLPDIRIQPLLSSNNKNNHWVFWSKKRGPDDMFKLAGSSQNIYVSSYKGDIPDIFPSDWIHIEAAREIVPALPKTFSFARFLEPLPWWHASIGLKEVQTQISKMKRVKVKIGIIDSGIDLNHDEFSHFIDTAQTYDFVEEDIIPNDEHGHGTHVTGIIAGQNTGVFPEAELIIAKVLNERGASNSIDLARSIVWSADSGAQMLNFSWGGGFDTQVLRDAIQYAESKNILMLTSAGNNAINIDKHPQVPSKMGKIINIASYNKKGRLARHSNFGSKSVLFAAPGSDIYSSYTSESGYKLMSGTSMAVAIASGSLGLLKSVEIFAEDLKTENDIVEYTCTKITKYWQKFSKCGQLKVLDVFKTLND